MISTDLGRLITKEQDEIRRINETHTRDLAAANARLALLQDVRLLVTPEIEAAVVRLVDAGLWPGSKDISGRTR